MERESNTSSTGPAEAERDFSPSGSHFVAGRRHSSVVSSKNSDDKNYPDENEKTPTDAEQQLVKDVQEESAEDDTLSDELEGTTSGRSSGTTSDRSSGTTSDRSSRMSSLRPEHGTSRQSACSSSDLISPSIEVISPRSERSTELTLNRVQGFFSSRPNWNSPTPWPAGPRTRRVKKKGLK